MNTTDQYRYPGPNEFEDTPAGRALFSGRDDEIRAITNQIVASRLLVLYAYSGFGKSSLLKAGVCPKLREQGYLPIRVRLNASSSLLALIAGSCEEVSREFQVDYTPGEGSTPWEFFKTAMFWRSDTLLFPVLVFDQFEEIFTLAPAEWRKHFAEAIGSLASGNLPAGLRQQHTGENSEVSDSPPKVKIVFSLREEYYGSLQELSSEFPALFQDRFRLLAMDESQAVSAIRDPAIRPFHDAFNCVTPAFVYSDDTIEAMIRFLKGRHESIEPFQLQLLCQYVERNVVLGRTASPSGVVEVLPSDLGGEQAMSDIVRRFYTDSLNELTLPEKRRAQELCDTGLLSSDGHRLPMQKDEILRNYGISEETLEYLVQRRILREEPRLDSVFYEIGHDTIAKSIFRNRPRRLPKKWRPVLKVSAAFLLAFVCFAVWFVWRLHNENEIEKTATRRARESQEKAEKLVSFLIGEDLLEKIRPLGKLEILDNIQKQVDNYAKVQADSSDTQLRNVGLAHLNKGDLEYARYQLEDADREYAKAISTFEALQRRKSAQFDLHDLADAEAKTAQILEDQLQLSKSYNLSQRVLKMQQELASQKRGDHDKLMRDEAQTHIRLGEILGKQGKVTEALQRFESAAVMTPPVEKSEVEWLYIRQDALTGKGELLRKQGRADAARKSLGQAEKCAERAVALSPFSPEAHYRIATAYDASANLMNDNPQEALAKYREVNKDVEEAAKWDSTNMQWKRDRAATYMLLGDGNAALQNWKQAAEKYEEAEKQLGELMQLRPNSVQLKTDLVWLRQSLGWALYSLEKDKQNSAGSVAALRNLSLRTDEMARSATSQSDTPPTIPGAAEPRLLASSAGGARSPALKQFDSAMQMLNDLNGIDSTDEQLRERFTGLLWRKVIVQQLGGDNRAVLATCKKGLDELGEKPVDATDSDYVVNKAFFLSSIAAAHQSIGNESSLKGDVKKAAASYAESERSTQAAVKAWHQAVSLAPGNAEYHNRLFLLLYDRLAPLRLEKKDEAGALSAYREGAAEVEKSAALDSKNAVFRANVALVRQQIGDRLRATSAAEALNSYEKSEQAWQAAIKLKPEAPDYHNRLFLLLYDHIGPLRLKQNDPAGALSAHRDAASAVERAADLDPKNPVYRTNLAFARQQIGDDLRKRFDIAGARTSYAQSEQAWRAAIALKPDSADYQNRLFLLFYDHVANLEASQNKEDAQLKAYLTSIEAEEKAVAQESKNPVYQSNLGLGYELAGDKLNEEGRLSEIQSLYEKSLAAFNKAALLDPKNARYMDNIGALYYLRIAKLCDQKKDEAGALEAFREAARIEHKTTALAPDNPVYRLSLAYAEQQVGDRLRTQRNLGESETAFNQAEEALRASIRLKEDPGTWHALSIHFFSHVSALRTDQKNPAGILDAFRNSVEAEKHAVALQPQNVIYRVQLAVDEASTGGQLRAQGKLSEAQTSYAAALDFLTEAIQIQPRNSDAWRRRYDVFQDGIAPLREAQHDQAGALQAYESGLEAIEHAIEVNPRFAEYHENRALALLKIGRLRHDRGQLALTAGAYTEGVRALEKAAALDPRAARYQNLYSMYMTWLVPLRREQKNRSGVAEGLQAALAAAQKAAGLEPANAEHRYIAATAQLQIGNEWRTAGKTNEALESYGHAESSFRDAIRLKNNDARYWSGLSETLQKLAQNNRPEDQTTAKARYQEALEAISKSTELDPREANYKTQRTLLETQIQHPASK